MGLEYQAPVAFGAAQAYLRSIEPLFDELEQRVRERNAGSSQAATTNPGAIAPIVSGIAFSIELLLKVLQIQEIGSASRGHDLFALWKPLSEETKAKIESRYKNSLHSWFTRHGLPFVHMNTTAAPDTEFDPEPSPTVAQALQRLGKSFELWRYMYELMKDGGVLYFNFAEAFGATDAIRTEILEFAGNAEVQMSREPK
jgi:hypothetical protein